MRYIIETSDGFIVGTFDQSSQSRHIQIPHDNKTRILSADFGLGTFVEEPIVITYIVEQPGGFTTEVRSDGSRPDGRYIASPNVPDGDTITSVDFDAGTYVTAPAPTPLEKISAWKFHAVLGLAENAALKGSVETAISALPTELERVVAQQKYSGATVFDPEEPLVLSIKSVLVASGAITAADFDTKWRQAMAIS